MRGGGRRPGERGAALLAVLLLVAVVGAIAAAALESLRLSRGLALNAASLERARGFAGGAEALAIVTIEDAIAASPERTTLSGGWHGAMRRVPLPGGVGEARIIVTDGGNCFNLNSLVEGDPRTRLARRPSGVSQFAGLMQALGVDPASAQGIAEAAADWADSDTAPGPGGAEDNLYLSRAPPYRAGNSLFADVGELEAVAGLDATTIERLRPFVCALPITDLSPINVNTLAPDRAALISMLAPGQLDLAGARRALDRRPRAGWTSPLEFWRDAVQRDLVVPLDVRLQVQVRTNWFAVETRAMIGTSDFRETLLIDARLLPARIALRRWGW